MHAEDNLLLQLDRQHEQLMRRIDELDKMIEDVLQEWGASVEPTVTTTTTTSTAGSPAPESSSHTKN